MTEERWDDFNFEEEKQTVRALTLPNSVIEQICRYLPNKKDKYTALWIHRQWTTAAQNVLWEYGHFKLPSSFRLFQKSVLEKRKLALLVKDIYLAMMDQGSSDSSNHLQETLFPPVVRSRQARHDDKNELAKSQYISRFATACENLTALTCYGWNLTSRDFSKLVTVAKNLTSLSLIGAPAGHIHDLDIGLLSRFTTLRLDGEFHLDEPWAEQLIKRATHLLVLQISLQDMSFNTLMRICTLPSRLPLTELVLTDATHMMDSHTVHILGGFPNLTRFVVEGSTSVTAGSIVSAIKTLANLSSLEIRAGSASLEQQDVIPQPIQLDHSFALLSRLVLENVKITNDQLVDLAPSFTNLQTLGLKNCPLITSSGIERCLETNTIQYLRVVHISNCLDVDSGVFAAFASVSSVAKSLFRVQLESCGASDPRDVYDLCSASADYNLREITIIGDEAIQDTIIGSFAQTSTKPVAGEDDSTIIAELAVTTLNRTSIDALAHSTDPEIYRLPEDRTLSGTQIALLASHFKLTLNHFIDVLDETQEEAEEAMMNQSNRQVNGKAPHKKNISFDASTSYSKPSAVNNRLYALKGQNSSQRPTTPALWSTDFQDNMHVADDYEEDNSQGSSTSDRTLGDDHYIQPATESESDEYGNVTTSDDDQYMQQNERFTEPSEQEEEEEEQVKEQEQDEDDDIEEYILGSAITQNQPVTSDVKWANNPLTSDNARSEIMLGGWGTSGVEGWNTHSKGQSNTPSASSSSSKINQKGKFSTSRVQRQQAQPQPQVQAWTGYVEENYRDHWQQSGLEVNKTRVTNKLFGSQKHSRNGPVIAESDGWGTPQAHVSWGNPQLSYSKEVLEAQKNTSYWRQNADGSWEMVFDPAAQNATAAAATATTTPTTTNGSPAGPSHATTSNDEDDNATLCNNSPPMLFTDIVAGTASSSASNMINNRNIRTNGNGRHKTHNRVNNNNNNSKSKLNNNNNNNNNNNTSNNNNIVRPVPRKRSGSLLSDDGQVNWSDTADTKIKLDGPHVNGNGYKSTATTTNGKKPETRSNWASLDDWKANKDSSASSFNESSASSPSKVNQDETATGEWSSINAQRFSRPARRSSGARYNHTNARESNNNTTSNIETFNSWADYTISNINISPPPRANNPSPFSNKSPQAPPAQQQQQQQQQAQQAPPAQTENAMMLIDTDKFAPARPQLKGEVWESISSLGVPSVTRPLSSQMLIPQEVNHQPIKPQPSSPKQQQQAATTTSAHTIEVMNWSDHNSSQENHGSAIGDLFHFTERQPGTITQTELDMQAETQAQDTLINFEDFLTCASPITPASPALSQQQQQQLNGSIMDSPRQVDSPVQVNGDVADLWKSLATTTTITAMNGNGSVLSDMGGMMTPTSATSMTPTPTAASITPTPSTIYTNGTNGVPDDVAAESSPSPPPAADDSVGTMDVSSPNESDGNAATDTPAQPDEFDPNTTASTNQEASSSAAMDTATADPKKKIINLRMKVQVREGVYRDLHVAAAKDDEVKKSVQDFCAEHDRTDLFEKLYANSLETWTAKRTKYILAYYQSRNQD